MKEEEEVINARAHAPTFLHTAACWLLTLYHKREEFLVLEHATFICVRLFVVVMQRMVEEEETFRRWGKS